MAIEGGGYKKVNTTLLKDVVLIPFEWTLPLLKAPWIKLQKAGIERIQDKLFQLPGALPF